MIIKDGHAVYPLRITRIYRGDRLVYYRNSALIGASDLALDLEALLLDRASAPAETEIPFCDFTLGGDLTPRDSAPGELSKKLLVTVDGDLFVKDVAPGSELPPLRLALHVDGVAPDSVTGIVPRGFLVSAIGEANAPSTAYLGQTHFGQMETLGLGVHFSMAEAAAIPIEGFTAQARFSVDALVHPSDVSPIDSVPVHIASADLFGLVSLADSGSMQCENSGLTVALEAELWVNPLEWADPVLRNHVLGVTHVIDAVQEGSILKLY